MHLRFLYVFSQLNNFLVLNNIPLFGCTTVWLFIHLGCFEMLAIMNKAAVSIYAQVGHVFFVAPVTPDPDFFVSVYFLSSLLSCALREGREPCLVPCAFSAGACCQVC